MMRSMLKIKMQMIKNQQDSNTIAKGLLWACKRAAFSGSKQAFCTLKAMLLKSNKPMFRPSSLCFHPSTTLFSMQTIAFLFPSIPFAVKAETMDYC